MQKKVKMEDIAKKLQVSTVTVSKALNDKEGVSNDLKIQIKNMALKMGYTLHTAAPTTTGNIGIIVAERFSSREEDPMLSFYVRFFQTITFRLSRLGYYGLFESISYEDERNGVLPRLLQEKRIDGLIVLGQLQSSYLQKLIDTQIPLVFLDFYDENFEVDSVITDNFYSSYDLTNYLIHKGHTKVAFLGDIYATSSIQDRFCGYYKSLLAHRIPYRADYIISDRTEDGKIYSEFPLPADPPTAFVCSSDETAYILIRYLQRLGYNIPEDFSVVGFDSDSYALLSNPHITTVEVNMTEMAKRAAELILSKIKSHRKALGKILVKTRMIEQDSVRSLL